MPLFKHSRKRIGGGANELLGDQRGTHTEHFMGHHMLLSQARAEFHLLGFAALYVHQDFVTQSP